MRQSVTVKEIKSNGNAVIEMQRMSACGHSCDGCEGCGAPNVILAVEAKNRIGARKGDKVIVESSNKTIYKAAFMVYLLPIILFFAFYALGDALLKAGTISGIIGFFVGIGAAVLFNRYFAKSGGASFDIVAFEGNG